MRISVDVSGGDPHDVNSILELIDALEDLGYECEDNEVNPLVFNTGTSGDQLDKDLIDQTQAAIDEYFPGVQFKDLYEGE